MPKEIEYTSKSYHLSYELAEAVLQCGGSCSPEIAAEKLGVKITGSFRSLVGSATKFGFITSRSSQLAVTQLFKDIHLSYVPKEKQELSINAFLSVPTYRKLYDKFKGQALPVDILPKMLVKDYGVTGDAVLVGNIFIKGGEQLGFIKDNRVIEIKDGLLQPMIDKNSVKEKPKQETKNTSGENQPTKSKPSPKVATPVPQIKPHTPEVIPDEITVMIKGKGMNYTIPLHDKTDWEILNAILKKVKLKTSENKDPA